MEDSTSHLRHEKKASYAPFGALHLVDLLEHAPRLVWEFHLDFARTKDVLGREPDSQDPCLASWGRLSLAEAGSLARLDEEDSLAFLKDRIGDGLAPDSYFLSLVYQVPGRSPWRAT